MPTASGGESDMDTRALAQWAEAHAAGDVDQSSDRSLSLASRLLRFRWNGAPTVGLGSDVDGKARIDSVLDGVSWFLARRDATDDTLRLILGILTEEDAAQPPLKEHLGAIGTMISELESGPVIRVWLITPNGKPTEITVRKPAFTTTTPQRWSGMLMSVAAKPVTGMAADLVAAVNHPSFALYPKLTSQTSAEPWQMRLDGLAIGSAGFATATLELPSNNPDAPGEPRDTWRRVIGQGPIPFAPSSADHPITLIKELIDSWTTADNPAAVLSHGQPEHALEAHILSGRLQLATADMPLHPAVPFRSGVLRAAQFPTLWGNVTSPARYLDALLCDDEQRPWAVELKDQASGGHGAYLRHGIGQAVLYRHFIRSADPLEPWFAQHGLKRLECRAALAFPAAATRTTGKIAELRDLASRYNVEVIEFDRPGAPELS